MGAPGECSEGKAGRIWGWLRQWVVNMWSGHVASSLPGTDVLALSRACPVLMLLRFYGRLCLTAVSPTRLMQEPSHILLTHFLSWTCFRVVILTVQTVAVFVKPFSILRHYLPSLCETGSPALLPSRFRVWLSLRREPKSRGGALRSCPETRPRVILAVTLTAPG